MIGLFSGIGGFEVAGEAVGWEVVATCEKDPFCRKSLKHYFPNAIHYEDIYETDFTKHRGTVDVLTGGFPCQPFSTAGKRAGTDDDRYLWPEYLRCIREVGPRWIVGENVAGLLSMENELPFEKWIPLGMEIKIRLREKYNRYKYRKRQSFVLKGILDDLEKEGYQVEVYVIPACSVGAVHKRERIWIDAYTTNPGVKNMRKQEIKTNSITNAPNPRSLERNEAGQEGQQRRSGRETFNKPERTGAQGTDSNPRSEGLQGGQLGEAHGGGGTQPHGATPELRETRDEGAWPTEPPVCGPDDGFSSQLDGITFSKLRKESLKAYGNAVHPGVVIEIFKAINDYENTRT